MVLHLYGTEFNNKRLPNKPLFFCFTIWYWYSSKSGWTTFKHVYKTIDVSVRQSAPPLHLETDNTYNSPLSWPCYPSKYKRHQSKATLPYFAEMFGSMRQLRKLRKEDHEASLLLHTKDLDSQKTHQHMKNFCSFIWLKPQSRCTKSTQKSKIKRWFQEYEEAREKER